MQNSGWKIEKSPGPIEYWTIEMVSVDDKMKPLRQGVNGGLYKKEGPENISVSFISVESTDKHIEKIKASGGKIVQQKQKVPGVGWIAIVLDPEGN